MMSRELWSELARKLDWEFSYVKEEDVFPEVMSGRPWMKHEKWAHWEEPFRTNYSEYVRTQCGKDHALFAVRDAIGKSEDYQKLDKAWVNGLNYMPRRCRWRSSQL